METDVFAEICLVADFKKRGGGFFGVLLTVSVFNHLINAVGDRQKRLLVLAGKTL